MNNIHNNHSFNLVAVPSTPRPRNTDNAQPQTTASLTEKPEESERFRMRRMRIRQYEREQAMEDRAAVMMIQQHRESLLEQFASVKTEFSDLDGLSWSDPQARKMLDRWHRTSQSAYRHSSKPPTRDENNLPFEGLPVSFSSPCQLEGLTSAPNGTLYISPYNFSKPPPSSLDNTQGDLPVPTTTTRAALTTMSSSPQITYDPPEFSSLDLHTPTVEKMNGTFPAVVFPAGPQQHSNTKKSTSVAGSELRMRRCPASLGNGSRVLENQEIVLVSNVATVRKKPCGPRHVA